MKAKSRKQKAEMLAQDARVPPGFPLSAFCFLLW
jgi:hypothetical protein